MSHQFYETNYLDFYDPDKCIGDLGEKWCNFEWRIYDLHLSPQKTFQSPIFTTRLLQNTHWYLEVQLSYPGNLKTMKISLCRLQNDETSVSTVDVIYRVIFDEDSTISDKVTLVYNNQKPGDERFYSAPIRKSKKGYVTIECKLRPNKIMIQNVRHDKLSDTLAVHLRKLLHSGDYSNAIIHVGDQELMAHFGVIKARLPELVIGNTYWIEGKYIIKINDLPVPVVKEMLKYAYTGQAYLDSNFISGCRDILSRYNKFFQGSCWEDRPFATTSFNYETDSLLWSLKEVCTKSNLGSNQLELLRLHSNKLEFSLRVSDSEKGMKGLELSFKYCGEEMPKPTIMYCKYSFISKDTNETCDIRETETLLHSTITEGKEYVCLISARSTNSFLKVDFKFCYGSSKSCIENLYEGQFDISQCTSCASLTHDILSFKGNLY